MNELIEISKNHSDTKRETTEVSWLYPNIGTCGDEVDLLNVSICRPRAMPDLAIGFDGERNGWVVGHLWWNQDFTERVFTELAFIDEEVMEALETNTEPTEE